MAREIYTHDIAAWKSKDALANPTPLQTALAAEGIGKAEGLLRAGWRSLSSWITSQERDIASGHRETPQIRSTATPTGSPPSALGHNDFDAEWEEVLAAREAAKRLSGSPR